MMRTTILYDGEEYVVAHRASEVRALVEQILATGRPGWLTVNRGRGQLQEAEILITQSTAIALIDTSVVDKTPGTRTAS